MVSSRLSF